MSEIFNIKAILSGPEICNQTTSDELFNLQRACNYTGLEILDKKQNSTEHVDDFKDILNTSSVKLISGILCFLLITFTNAFNVIVSMFEKHGGDPLKRSLINQLIVQIGYCMIINNTICNPLLTWRIFFGPIYAGIAAFNSFCKSTALVWLMTCLTEVFIVKVLMLYKFSYMADIDDTFLSRFLFLENIGFVLLSQLSRFYLGSMYESAEFQILSGIMVSEELIFWPIYGTIMYIVFGLAFGSIAIKTIMEKFKECKLQQSLKVNTQENCFTIEGQENSQENEIATPLKINNFKYNVPLLTGIHYGVLGGTSFILFAIFVTLAFLKLYVYPTMDDKMIPYQAFLYRTFFLESILFSFILPIMYLATKKDLLRFMKNMIK